MSTGYLERIGTYGVLSVFSVLAIYPVLSILFLALHRKTDLVTGFAFPTRLDLSSFKAAWTEGRFGTGFKSSFIVAAAVTAVYAVLSIGTGYAFGTMRFFGDRIVFPIVLLGIISLAGVDMWAIRRFGLRQHRKIQVPCPCVHQANGNPPFNPPVESDQNIELLDRISVAIHRAQQVGELLTCGDGTGRQLDGLL